VYNEKIRKRNEKDNEKEPKNNRPNTTNFCEYYFFLNS